MGLGAQFLDELIALKRSDAVTTGKVIEIGAQQLANSFLRADGTLGEAYRLFDCRRPDLGTPRDAGIVDGLEHQPDDAPSSRQFWESLGFNYACIDFGGLRDSFAVDLNRDAVPRRLRGTGDLVVNAGTTEHVANQDNAFRVIHDLTRRGGLMIHEVPAGGLFTHGLVSYNIKFFWHLCRENRYRVVSLRVDDSGTLPMPKDLIDSNLQFGGGIGAASDAEVRCFTIRAALRKSDDLAFVTPMDIPEKV